MKCPDCGEKLEDISADYTKNKTKLYRCNNEKCEGESSFYDEHGHHIKCSICGTNCTKIEHFLPDVYVNGKWYCRDCVMGMLLRDADAMGIG
jgi:hypothetical protein